MSGRGTCSAKTPAEGFSDSLSGASRRDSSQSWSIFSTRSSKRSTVDRDMPTVSVCQAVSGSRRAMVSGKRKKRGQIGNDMVR